MNLNNLNMRSKSAYIDQIANGFTVELTTPREGKDDFGKEETFFFATLKEVSEKLEEFYQ